MQGTPGGGLRAVYAATVYGWAVRGEYRVEGLKKFGYLFAITSDGQVWVGVREDFSSKIATGLPRQGGIVMDGPWAARHEPMSSAYRDIAVKVAAAVLRGSASGVIITVEADPRMLQF